MSTTTQIPPDVQRRLENLTKFWAERTQALNNDADLAKVCFDRAKAAAKRAQRGGDTRVMHELAELLATWAAEREYDEAMRSVRNAS